ncbi:MAG: S9 family peptidase, partial [Pseudomonadota bacterium]
MKSVLLTSAATVALAACSATDLLSAPEAPAAPAIAEVETVPEPAPVAAPLESFDIIERKAIFGNPERTQGRISPDGSHVSWLAPLDGVLNIYVAPADDPSAARSITADDNRGINQHSWAPNSKFVYYVQDTGGDENFHVYAVDVETGDVADLTP